MKAGGISVHVVDVSRAVPAAGMRIELYRLDDQGQRQCLVDKVLNGQGMLVDPVNKGEGLEGGYYEAIFYVGDYYRKEKIALPEPAFIDVVPFRFNLTELERHHHLPLKITPWGFSLFRTA